MNDQDFYWSSEIQVNVKLIHLLNVHIYRHLQLMGVNHMLWWIIGIAVGFGVLSGFLRRTFSTNSFEAGNQNERQIQEEERVKAGSWFTGGQ